MRKNWKSYLDAHVSKEIKGSSLCVPITPREAKGLFHVLLLTLVDVDNEKDKTFDDVMDNAMRDHVLNVLEDGRNRDYPYISLHIEEAKIVLDDIYALFLKSDADYSDFGRAFKKIHLNTWSDYKLATGQFAQSLMKALTR